MAIRPTRCNHANRLGLLLKLSMPGTEVCEALTALARRASSSSAMLRDHTVFREPASVIRTQSCFPMRRFVQHSIHRSGGASDDGSRAAASTGEPIVRFPAAYRVQGCVIQPSTGHQPSAAGLREGYSKGRQCPLAVVSRLMM